MRYDSGSRDSRLYHTDPASLDEKRDEILTGYDYWVEDTDTDAVGKVLSKRVTVKTRQGETVGTYETRLAAIRALLCPEYGKSIKSMRDLHSYCARKGICD